MKPNSSLLALAANMALLNDNSKFFPASDDSARTGLIMAANDANFDAANLSEPLTEMVIDTPDSDGLDVLLEAAFPSVPVGRHFSYVSHDSVEAFQAALNNEDVRVIGGDFAEIKLTGTMNESRTDNKGLTIILDNDQGGEDAAVQQAAVLNLRNRLLRSDLLRGVALLEANMTSTSYNWKTAGSDPDGNLAAQIDLSGDDRGINPSVALYGGGAWTKRYLGLGVDANSGKFASRSLLPQQVADLLGLDSVLKSNFRYQSSSTAKTKVVADAVYVYYAKRGASVGDPSNVKRFVTSVPGGGMIRVYIQPLLKRTKVTVEQYSRIVLTSSLGIRKLAVSFS